MSQENLENSQQDYEIVIVQCCENCDTHQSFSRHSEWKYFEQFNQLKRKIQRFVPNTIVIKNPVPDQLLKPTDVKLDKNTYVNKNNNQKVTFPRIGAFEIYIYNVLISSKLMNNSWPNHYKILQTLNQIIESKKNGLSLQQYSVYNTQQSKVQKVQKFQKTQKVVSNSPKNSPQKKAPRIVSKKKKSTTGNQFRVYKSKEKSTIEPKQKFSYEEQQKNIIQSKKLTNLDPIFFSQSTKTKRIPNTLLNINESPKRNIQSKNEARVKLPSLKNTINFQEEEHQQSFKEQDKQPFRATKKNSSQKSSQQSNSILANDKSLSDQKSFNKIFNSIEQFQNQQMSIIERKASIIEEQNKFDSLLLNQNQSSQIKVSINDQDNQMIDLQQQIKFLENRSVQYSQRQYGKDFMNRSIQYYEEEGYHMDFAIQIDDLSMPKEINYQFVQTQFVQPPALKQQKLPQKKPKPYMLDEIVQANIILKKKQKSQEIQTMKTPIQEKEVNTQILAYVNRGYQFPEEQEKKVQGIKIDPSFQHLYQKRRNIIDNQWYSIDRFQQKATKYKWVGKGNPQITPDQLKIKMYVECLVFSVYNYFGIKTPQKRLSYQQCSNVVADKAKSSIYHMMTFDNPQIQYPFQFQELNLEEKKYPISELLTFKTSKQSIKFSNWGSFLAIAYFLKDTQIFTQKSKIGLVITNQQVKQIHKLSAYDYTIFHQDLKFKNKDEILVNSSQENYIKIDRLSKQTQLEFIAMLSKITDQHFFNQMMKNIEQIFIHKSSAHKTFQNTLKSLALQEVKTASIIEAFINKLKFQYESINEYFRGRIYTYRTYHSLQANIKFDMGVEYYIQRKMKYQDKKVAKSDVLKHIRNKDNIVFIYGEQGYGKSTLLKKLSDQLKQIDRYNIVTVLNPQKQLKSAINQLQESIKNIILIDDIQTNIEETLKFLVKAAQKYQQNDLSFCLATTSERIMDNFKIRFTKMKVVRIDVEPLDNEQIRNYMTNSIHKKHFTQRKEIVDMAIENISKIQIVRNIFYLNLYCKLVTDLKSADEYKIPTKSLTKYDVLKQTFAKCIQHHRNQLRQMMVQVKEPMTDIRRIALQQFHGIDQLSDLITDTISLYDQDNLLRNQLQFYPLNLNYQMNSMPLFIHSQFHKFLIVQAYSFFVQKGYRNMKMNMLYENQSLMQLIKQKYQADQNYQNLLQIVYESNTYPNTQEQASNAITLLCQMDYTFSNLNFDNCQIPDADLNSSIFYSCTFRNSNMEKVVLYKTQMINCQVENVVMDSINLYMRKYQIQFTALTCSLSIDGRSIALGCGNYLIILNATTGKQIKKIQAHLDIIRTVRYSKDGNSLITIADDKTLRIWDVVTFRSVVFKLPQKGSINFSNQTETIASVSKKQLKVWNIKSMANQSICQGHNDLITTVNFSTDGQNIVTGSRDCTLRLWSLKGQQKHIYKGHDNQILVGKFSPNNRTIISSSKKKDIIIWQTQTQTKIVEKQFSNQVIEICPDNREHYVIITFSHDSDIVVLNFNNLEVVHNLKGHKNRVLSINFDSGFKKLISLSKDRNVRLWDISQILMIQEKIAKKNNFKIHKGPVLSIAYDKSNQRYATGHLNGQINVWSSQDNRLLDQVCDHLGAVRCLSYDKTGKLYSGGADGILRIWTLPANRQPRKLQLYSVQMLTLKLSEKNRIMVTSSANDQLVIYDFTGIKLLMSTRQQGKIFSVAFSRDQKYMAVGGSQKCIIMYQIHNNGNTISRMEEYEQHTDAINCLAFQGDSLLICALKNGHIFIWNYLRGNLIKKIQNISPIKSLLIFQKKFACFSSQDGKIRIINMDEGKQVKVFRYSDICNAMIANEDESLVYVGGNQGNIVKWNLNSVKPLTSKLRFPRKAIDQDCTKIISIQSSRSLKIQSLFEHKQDIVEVNCPYDIQGVNFHENKIILLLKNEVYWQLGRKQYQFNSQKREQGDLSYIRDRFTNFYKTGVKKVKGISKPTQTIVQQLSIG